MYKKEMEIIIDYMVTVFRCRFLLLAFGMVLTTVAPARADVRDDVAYAVANLHQLGAVQRFPDDMQSLELVAEVAERYTMAGESEIADKFYLMALQKSQILEMKLTMPEDPVAPVVGEISAPEHLPPMVTQEDEPEYEQPGEVQSVRLIGSKGVYTVVKDDTIPLVSAKLGVTSQHLRSMNGLDTKTTLKAGQKLTYNNRKIIPQRVRDGIIVNIPDRTLYYFQSGTLVRSLPVALGSVTKNEKYDWQTPLGKFKITGKVKDPTWTVPSSIQAEMEEHGKEVTVSVPPGPKNPLGKYAMKTSIPGILIHSTTRPSSIYGFSSHGCIRVSPDQMEDFFPKIKVNTSGEIIYKPVKLAVTENGRIFLEVHQDIYNKSVNLVDQARQMVEKQKLSGKVDWKKFADVLKQKRGVAEDISL